MKLTAQTDKAFFIQGFSQTFFHLSSISIIGILPYRSLACQEKNKNYLKIVQIYLVDKLFLRISIDIGYAYSVLGNYITNLARFFFINQQIRVNIYVMAVAVAQKWTFEQIRPHLEKWAKVYHRRNTQIEVDELINVGWLAVHTATKIKCVAATIREGMRRYLQQQCNRFPAHLGVLNRKRIPLKKLKNLEDYQLSENCTKEESVEVAEDAVKRLCGYLQGDELKLIKLKLAGCSHIQIANCMGIGSKNPAVCVSMWYSKILKKCRNFLKNTAD